MVFHTGPRQPARYTSAGFGRLCQGLGVRQSMGATGVCWDNAAAESFFGTLKRELAHRQRWGTRADARRAVVHGIEDGSTLGACTRA
ncbi:MAG: DDE-type integrase/transposase/recombinase [Acidimicrobiia bacterium]|nr:DDE-type integrase/transposase/recombinase [Acidimicrobiia bacterium]